MKTIQVSDETFELIKDQLGTEEKIDIGSLTDLINQTFLFRCVTYHQVGKVEKILGNIIELSNASWVADSGIFGEALKKGTLKESEYVGQAFVNLNTVVDFFPWKHKLPSKSK